MTTYKELKGTNIEVNSSDPSNPLEGQVWFNSTSNVLKGQRPTLAGSWSTGGNINTARYVPGGGGSKTASIMFGGQPGGGTSANNTELYNGSTWTEVNNLNTARERSASAANSQTAALCITGVVYPGASVNAANESWNGTSWTEVNDVNTARDGPFGIGTPSAAVIAGGSAPPNSNVTETWNGSSWTTSPATLGQGRKDNESGGAGTSTAGIIAGGNNGSTYGNTEYWNGSAWSEQNDLNTARSGFALSGGQPAALAMGGSPSTAITENWNGTNWTEVADLPTTKRNHAGSKVTADTSAIVMGGYVTAAVATSFEWSLTDLVGSWSTGGDLNQAKRDLGSAGTTTAAVAFGGNVPPSTVNTELYNGSNWTEVNNLNSARASLGSNGTQTSALGYGGGPPMVAITESWNGTNWTEVNDLNTARNSGAGAGADSTAAIYFGGYDGTSPVNSGRVNSTESFNGTNWTEVNNLNTGRNSHAGNGTVTSALAYGGYNSSGSPTADTEVWNGTNWTEVNNLNTARYSGGGAGADSTSALYFGGTGPPPRMANTEEWNGTNWTEVADLNVAREDIKSGGTGTVPAALAIGGEIATGPTAATEEWAAKVPTTVTFSDSE